MGIVNAGALPIYEQIDPHLRELCENLILNKHEDATEKLLQFALVGLPILKFYLHVNFPISDRNFFVWASKAIKRVRFCLVDAEQEAKTKTAPGSESAIPVWRQGDVESRVEYALVHGIDKFIVADVEEARLNKQLYPRCLHIIEGPLMKGHFSSAKYNTF